MVMGEFTQETDLLVIGGGPGGYAAAFRAADLGMDVTMVEADPGREEYACSEAVSRQRPCSTLLNSCTIPGARVRWASPLPSRK